MIVIHVITGCYNGADDDTVPGDEVPLKAVIDWTPDNLPLSSRVIVVDGSGSEGPQNSSIQYSWSLKKKPENSALTISHITDSSFNLIPDRPGHYMISLTVTSGSSTDTTSSLIRVWHDTSATIAGDKTVLAFTRNGSRYEARFTFNGEWKNRLMDDTNKYLYFDMMLYDRYDESTGKYFWWSTDGTETSSSGTKIIASADNDDLPDEYDLGVFSLEELRNFDRIDTMMTVMDAASNHLVYYETCLEENQVQVVMQ